MMSNRPCRMMRSCSNSLMPVEIERLVVGIDREADILTKFLEIRLLLVLENVAVEERHSH